MKQKAMRQNLTVLHDSTSRLKTIDRSKFFKRL